MFSNIGADCMLSKLCLHRCLLTWFLSCSSRIRPRTHDVWSTQRKYLRQSSHMVRTRAGLIVCDAGILILNKGSPHLHMAFFWCAWLYMKPEDFIRRRMVSLAWLLWKFSCWIKFYISWRMCISPFAIISGLTERYWWFQNDILHLYHGCCRPRRAVYCCIRYNIRLRRPDYSRRARSAYDY